MPNNFRLTGAFYTSKDGNDGNAGTGPNISKATPGDYGAGDHIWGAGDYKGAFNFGASTDTFKADGVVKIQATADILFAATCLTKFEDVFFNTNTFAFYVGSGSYAYLYFVRCILKNGFFSFQPQVFDNRLYLTNSVAVDMATTNANARLYAAKTQFFNCAIQIADDKSMTDCYADESSLFSMATYFATPSLEFKNNNFRGQISVAGTPYELKKNKAGGVINPNPGVADLAVIDATVYDRGNFSEDPLFLNISKGDYWAVSPASPNIFADSTGIGNIGGVFAAQNIKATDGQFSSPELNDGTAYQSGDLIWASGNGLRISQPIQLSSVEGRAFKKAVLAGLKYFNSSEPIGAENQNAVTPFDYASGTAGANPWRVDILGWRMKTTDLETAPETTDDYDNGMLTQAAGDWIFSEILGNDTDFLVDSLGRGTGDPAFNPVGAGYMNRGWIQFRLVLLEGLVL